MSHENAEDAITGISEDIPKVAKFFEVNALMIPEPVYRRIMGGMTRYSARAGYQGLSFRDALVNLVLVGLAVVEAQEQKIREASQLIVDPSDQAPKGPGGLDMGQVSAKLQSLRQERIVSG